MAKKADTEGEDLRTSLEALSHRLQALVQGWAWNRCCVMPLSFFPFRPYFHSLFMFYAFLSFSIHIDEETKTLVQQVADVLSRLDEQQSDPVCSHPQLAAHATDSRLHRLSTYLKQSACHLRSSTRHASLPMTMRACLQQQCNRLP